MMTPFEYEPRWERLRALMRAHDVAAIVVCENGRTRYLTGYQRYFTATHVAPVHAVVLTADRGPDLLVPRHVVLAPDEHRAARWIALPFGEDSRVDAIAELLRAEIAGGARIAVELGFLGHLSVDKLAGRLAGATLVDAEPILRRATAVKFADEIAALRDAARAVDEGVGAAIDACVRGASELEVAARASARMLECGAEFINHMTVRSGPHAAGNFPFPTARRLEDGDCVQIDIGCVVRGYVSDTNRTVVVGRASPAQEAMFAVGQGMLEAGIAAIRPGVPAASIWDASFEVARRAGMAARVTLPFAGHGIGLSLHEMPFIQPGATTVLEENMVLALEPGVYAAGIGGSRPEEMIVVTAAGHEVITRYPRDADLCRARR
jgi:Xaa-Pro aminopeptidase